MKQKLLNLFIFTSLILLFSQSYAEYFCPPDKQCPAGKNCVCVQNNTGYDIGFNEAVSGENVYIDGKLANVKLFLYPDLNSCGNYYQSAKYFIPSDGAVHQIIFDDTKTAPDHLVHISSYRGTGGALDCSTDPNGLLKYQNEGARTCGTIKYLEFGCSDYETPNR
jgi:hypothetical protein